jgi:hypothetical protein
LQLVGVFGPVGDRRAPAVARRRAEYRFVAACSSSAFRRVTAIDARAGAARGASSVSILAGCSSSTRSSASRRRWPRKHLERCGSIDGAHRAQHADMHDADALEAINAEQLVTATDRMLLRGGRPSKRRPRARASYPHLPHGTGARGSWSQIGPQPGRHTTPAARWSEAFERTVPSRRRAAPAPQLFAITLAIPTLVGIAFGLAALL